MKISLPLSTGNVEEALVAAIKKGGVVYKHLSRENYVVKDRDTAHPRCHAIEFTVERPYARPVAKTLTASMTLIRVRKNVKKVG